jgi:predicted GTPase
MLNLFGNKKRSPRLVIGLNQVDKMVPNEWDKRLNLPTEKAEKQIKRRSQDSIQRLSQYTNLSPENIEYYSALRRYRLMPLLAKIVRNAYAGFKLDHIEPANPFELAAPEVQEFAEQKRQERKKQQGNRRAANKDQLFEEMSQFLSKDELNLLLDKFNQERSRPPKVAIFGKAGVGKTTTINNLFNARWKTSHTMVGTTDAQTKEFELNSGGKLNVIDLPGYGRSIAEDQEYETIYRQLIPSCDLVLLILQANTRDFTDDQEMIINIMEWLEESGVPKR